jgi:hypothetical protein
MQLLELHVLDVFETLEVESLELELPTSSVPGSMAPMICIESTRAYKVAKLGLSRHAEHSIPSSTKADREGRDRGRCDLH